MEGLDGCLLGCLELGPRYPGCSVMWLHKVLGTWSFRQLRPEGSSVGECKASKVWEAAQRCDYGRRLRGYLSGVGVLSLPPELCSTHKRSSRRLPLLRPSTSKFWWVFTHVCLRATCKYLNTTSCVVSDGTDLLG